MYTFLECYQLEYPLFLHKTVSKRTVHSVHVATQRLGPTTKDFNSSKAQPLLMIQLALPRS